jgi:hypothetical protein
VLRAQSALDDTLENVRRTPGDPVAGSATSNCSSFPSGSFGVPSS